MKRFIYAVTAAIIILSGCEYNPLYDGQQFCVYHVDCGLLETDGGHIYVPIKSDEPYVLELYGGKGRKHTVTIDSPEYLDYSYEKGNVKGDGFMDMDIIPAGVTLLPKKLGMSTLTVTEEDTGEAISLTVHVCPAYKAIQVTDSRNSLANHTILAFRYDGVDDVVKICTGDFYEGSLECVTEGRYAFVPYESTVALELTYPADENEQPCAGGTEIKKIYKVEFYYGGGAGSAEAMLMYMSLKDFPVQTKAFQIPEYYYDFRYVDVTDGVYHDPESTDAKVFNARSAIIVPWKLD
jgi:hypothetical protein